MRTIKCDICGDTNSENSETYHTTNKVVSEYTGIEDVCDVCYGTAEGLSKYFDGVKRVDLLQIHALKLVQHSVDTLEEPEDPEETPSSEPSNDSAGDTNKEEPKETFPTRSFDDLEDALLSGKGINPDLAADPFNETGD